MLPRFCLPVLATCLLLSVLTNAALSNDAPVTDARVLESAVDRLDIERLAHRPSHSLDLDLATNQFARQSAAPAEPAPTDLPAGDIEPIIQLTPELAALREKVRQTLAVYYPLNLNTRDHNPWEVMHQIVAFGVKTNLRRGGPQGEQVNGVAYLCWNGDCRGRRILELNGGRVNAAKGPAVQGHYGQLLAILAQSAVPADYPLHVGGKQFTVDDLVETEMLGCQSGTELTFKLIGIAHYRDLDATWKNSRGEDWNVPRLLREEINAPVRRTTTCGGTHRMFSVAYPVRKLQRLGKPLTGEYLRAQIHTKNYQNYTLQLQNPDGSLSTEWFEGRGASPDLNRRLKTTGHILEWLVFSLEDDELDDPRVMKAVNYLSTILLESRTRQWEIGPLGHGLHALAIYEDRLTRLTDGYQTPDEMETEPKGGLADDTTGDAAALEFEESPLLDFLNALPLATEPLPGDIRTARRPAQAVVAPRIESSTPSVSSPEVAPPGEDSTLELDGPRLFAP